MDIEEKSYRYSFCPMLLLVILEETTDGVHSELKLDLSKDLSSTRQHTCRPHADFVYICVFQSLTYLTMWELAHLTFHPDNYRNISLCLAVFLVSVSLSAIRRHQSSCPQFRCVLGPDHTISRRPWQPFWSCQCTHALSFQTPISIATK